MNKGKPNIGESGPVNEEELGLIGKQDGQKMVDVEDSLIIADIEAAIGKSNASMANISMGCSVAKIPVLDEMAKKYKADMEAAEDRAFTKALEEAEQRSAFIKSLQVDTLRRAAGKLYDSNDKHWHYLNELADAVRDGEEEL